MAATDPVYTLKDLAAKTGIAYGTLRQWKNRGRLPKPTYQLGQSPAWAGKEIEQWLDTQPVAGNQYNRKAAS